MDQVRVDNSRIKVNSIILGAFILFVLTKLLYWLPEDILYDGISVWVYTDWLIDYSSGFIRRGLSGEIINLFSGFVHPVVFIAIISWSIFGTVIFGYIRLISKSLSSIKPLVLTAILFLPSLLPFYLYDHAAFGRKEVIGFLFLLWHLSTLVIDKKNSAGKLPSQKLYLKRILPLTLIILPIQILLHEASFLLFVPVHMIITLSIFRQDSSITPLSGIYRLGLVYLPVLITIMAVYIFGRPSLDTVIVLCNKWELAKVFGSGVCSLDGKEVMWALPGAFAALPWSFSQHISLTMSFSPRTIMYWCLIILILSIVTVYIGSEVSRSLMCKKYAGDSNNNQILSSANIIGLKYFLLPLLFSLPIYLAWDIGRWFAVTSINYIMITLSRELNFAENQIKKSCHLDIDLITRIPSLEGNMRWYMIIMFIILLIIFFLRLPHCCNITWLNILSEPLGNFIFLLLENI